MSRRPMDPRSAGRGMPTLPARAHRRHCRDLGRSIGSIHGQANMLGLKKSPEYMREIHGAHIADAGADTGSTPARPHGTRASPAAPATTPIPSAHSSSGRAPEEARNYQPIGTLHMDGYLQRKITDDRRCTRLAAGWRCTGSSGRSERPMPRALSSCSRSPAWPAPTRRNHD